MRVATTGANLYLAMRYVSEGQKSVLEKVENNVKPHDDAGVRYGTSSHLRHIVQA